MLTPRYEYRQRQRWTTRLAAAEVAAEVVVLERWREESKREERRARAAKAGATYQAA